MDEEEDDEEMCVRRVTDGDEADTLRGHVSICNTVNEGAPPLGVFINWRSTLHS